MTDLFTIKNAGRAVVVAALLVCGYWLRAAVGPGEEAVTVTDTVRVDRPMRQDDVPEASTPSEMRMYETPDSSDTYQQQITLPKWLRPKSTPNTDKKTPGPSTDSTGSQRQHTTDRKSSTDRPASQDWPNSVGPSYDIIPTTNGRPKVSVGAEQVRLSTINPLTGAGTTWTYRVPEWKWALRLRGSTLLSRSMLTTQVSVQLERNLDFGTIGIGPAYGVTVTESGYHAGPGITISFETTLWSYGD